MSDEPDDDDLLTETQLAALRAARYALVETIERLIGNDQRQIVQLVFIAVSGLLADMLSVSAGVPKLVDGAFPAPDEPGLGGWFQPAPLTDWLWTGLRSPALALLSF
jgi:hypothetical protein